MPVIQVFGFTNCRNTQKAERFFKERRVPIQFINLEEKEMSRGEINSVKAAVGLENLIDTESKEYKKRGLEYMDFDLEAELLANPQLLKTPIVRNGKLATAGYEPDVWTRWMSE